MKNTLCRIRRMMHRLRRHPLKSQTSTGSRLFNFFFFALLVAEMWMMVGTQTPSNEALLLYRGTQMMDTSSLWPTPCLISKKCPLICASILIFGMWSILLPLNLFLHPPLPLLASNITRKIRMCLWAVCTTVLLVNFLLFHFARVSFSEPSAKSLLGHKKGHTPSGHIIH